ncbi:MAG: tetratricopeptide repeat protein [Planctomycetota bacterium]
MKNLVITFCVAACVLALCGCKSRRKPRGEQEYNAEARTLMEEAEMTMSAMADVSHRLKTHPEFYKMRERLPEVYDIVISDVLKKLYDAYTLEPEWARVTFDIAACEQRLGNTDKALEFARLTLRLDPDFAWAYETIALAYSMAGQKAESRSERNSCYSEAIKAYKKFIEARPEDIRLESIQLNIRQMQLEMEKP